MNIRTYDQMIDVLVLMQANLPLYQAAVGATAANVAWVTNTLTNMVYIRDYCVTYEGNKKTAFDIKAKYFNGEQGDPIAVFPLMPEAELPNPPLTTGALTTLRELIARFKTAPGYNEEIGVALGFAGSPQTIDPGTIIPEIEVSAAQSEYLFSVVVSGRGQSDMWEVLTAKAGTTTWTVAKSATGKSTDVTMPPNNQESPTPYQIQVRVRLKKGNANYGQLSAISQITVNP